MTAIMAKGLRCRIAEELLSRTTIRRRTAVISWRAHANLLFSNWLNYYVYQETPYDWVQAFKMQACTELLEERRAEAHENRKPIGANRFRQGAGNRRGQLSRSIKPPRSAIRELGESTGFDYTRTKSPTRTVLEEAAADLESGDAGFACSSGMAALQTIFALFSARRPSARVAGPVRRHVPLARAGHARFGVTASYVDTNDIDALERAPQAEIRRRY